MFQTLEDLLRSLSLRGDAEFLQHVEGDLTRFLAGAPAPDATVQFPRLSEHRQQLIMSTARRFGMKAKTEVSVHSAVLHDISLTLPQEWGSSRVVTVTAAGGTIPQLLYRWHSWTSRS